MADIQPENHQNVQKTHFWQKTPGVNGLRWLNTVFDTAFHSFTVFSKTLDPLVFKNDSFQYSSYYFLKYFRAKYREILTRVLRNRRISEKAILHSVVLLLTDYACAAFNWVHSVTKKNLRSAEFFASIHFLTCLFNKRLNPSMQCLHLTRNLFSGLWFVLLTSLDSDRDS